MKRVFILSRQPTILGQGTERLLSESKRVQVVGLESDMEQAIARIRQLDPDVVLLIRDRLEDITPVAKRVQEAKSGVQVLGLNHEDNSMIIFPDERRWPRRLEEIVSIVAGEDKEGSGHDLPAQ
jgi:DNA-binding NarL/FixJ family response regulator